MVTGNKKIVVSNLPAIQRDLYLSRCVRRVEDTPILADTFRVEWEDMAVSFATDEAVSESSVEVAEDISIATFTSRMESLLDCGAKSDGAAEWTLKWADRISRYGSTEEVRRLLCDKIASLDGQTGETVGVLKIKRRSVESGYARVRLVPTDDSLQVVCRHQSAQGLKSVWKSVLWRLNPQLGDPSNKKAWAELRALARKHSWEIPGGRSLGYQCHVYENFVDMDVWCDYNDDRKVVRDRNVRLEGTPEYKNWKDLPGIIGTRPFQIIQDQDDKLFLKLL